MFFNFILRANAFYPDLAQATDNFIQDDKQMWMAMLEKGIRNGELRKEINLEITADKFRYIYMGMSFEQSYREGGVQYEKLKEVFYDLYEDIVLKKAPY